MSNNNINITDEELDLIKDKSRHDANNLWKEAVSTGERPVTKSVEEVLVEVRLHLLKFDKRLSRMENSMSSTEEKLSEVLSQLEQQNKTMSMMPKEKLLQYLTDRSQWSWEPDRNIQYYNYDPDYYILQREADSEIPFESMTDFSLEEWTQGEISKNTGFVLKELYYKERCLGKFYLVSFDDGKKHMINPDWKPLSHGRIYFYEEGTLRHALNMLVLEGQEQTIYLNHDAVERGSALFDQAKAQWPNLQASLPVMKTHELSSFLNDHPGTEKIEPYKNGNPLQYQTFVLNLLDFEKWRQGDFAGTSTKSST